MENGLVSYFVRMKSKETKHEKKKSWKEPKKISQHSRSIVYPEGTEAKFNKDTNLMGKTRKRKIYLKHVTKKNG